MKFWMTVCLALGAICGPALAADSITITDGHAPAMVTGAKVGGGYLKISNAGDEEDRLVSVSSPRAARVEVHEMTVDNDVMKMRAVTGGVAIPSKGAVSFQRGGLHLMFMQPQTPFQAGETVPVVLNFEKAGAVSADLSVDGR